MAQALGKQKKERPLQKLPRESQRKPEKIEPVPAAFTDADLDTARAKLFTYRKCNVHFRLNGVNLMVKGKLSELDRQNIQNWKPEIMELLRREVVERRDQVTEKIKAWQGAANRAKGYDWTKEDAAAWSDFGPVVDRFVNDGDVGLKVVHTAFLKLAAAHRASVRLLPTTPAPAPAKKEEATLKLPARIELTLEELPSGLFAIDVDDAAWRHAWFKVDLNTVVDKPAAQLEHVLVKRGWTNTAGGFSIQVLAVHRLHPYWFSLADVDVFLAVGRAVEAAHQEHIDAAWSKAWLMYWSK